MTMGNQQYVMQEGQVAIVNDRQTTAPNLFVRENGFHSVKLSDLTAEYYIDTSGSTTGSILQYEKISAAKMLQVIKGTHIVAWNDEATKVNSLNEMYSDGGTYPSCFVNMIAATNKCLVVYTDGEICVDDMRSFKSKMVGKVNEVPVIIVFAVSEFSMAIADMERIINMSIPEAFLSLSNDVVILVTANGDHRVLMTKGCFNKLHSIPLEMSTLLSELPPFDPIQLKEIVVTAVPANLIRLKNVDDFVDMNVLYTQEALPLEVLEGLTDRTLIPRLDLPRLQASLMQMNRKLSENAELDAIRKQLYEIAASEKVGSEEHRLLADKYNELKRRKREDMDTRKLRAINNILKYCTLRNIRAIPLPLCLAAIGRRVRDTTTQRTSTSWAHVFRSSAPSLWFAATPASF